MMIYFLYLDRCSSSSSTTPRRALILLNKPGIMSTDLGHIGGSNHPRKGQFEPWNNKVCKWATHFLKNKQHNHKLTIVGQPKKRRPGFLFVQEVLTIAGLPHVQTTIVALFFFWEDVCFTYLLCAQWTGIYMVHFLPTVEFLHNTHQILGTKHAKRLLQYTKGIGDERWEFEIGEKTKKPKLATSDNGRT